MFPEDREIFVSELIHMWVAEKFVPSKRESKPEVIAQANIEKLIARNLIQVSRRRADESVKGCRIHDLLYSFCIRAAEQNNFFCTNLNNTESSKVRRITVNTSDFINDSTCPENFHTLFYFRPSVEGLSEFLKRNVSNLRVLKHLVIEVEGRDQSLPGEIGNLIGLKSLKLKGRVDEIPASIQRLKNLLMLELDVPYRSIRSSILKMKQLKHLLLNCNSWFTIDLDFSSLETLDTIRLDCVTQNKMKNLTNIRKLGMVVESGSDLMGFVFPTTLMMPKLEGFKLEISGSRSGIPKLNFSRCQNLVKYKLHCDCDENLMPIYHSKFAPSLIQITLKKIHITPSLMESMEKLPKLQILKIKTCDFQSKALDFSGEHNFPELQVLKIWKGRLEYLIVDEEGMPKLEKFSYIEEEGRYRPLDIPDRLRKMMEIKKRG